MNQCDANVRKLASIRGWRTRTLSAIERMTARKRKSINIQSIVLCRHTPMCFYALSPSSFCWRKICTGTPKPFTNTHSVSLYLYHCIVHRTQCHIHFQCMSFFLSFRTNGNRGKKTRPAEQLNNKTSIRNEGNFGLAWSFSTRKNIMCLLVVFVYRSIKQSLYRVANVFHFCREYFT